MNRMASWEKSSSLSGLVDEETTATRQFVNDVMDFSSQYGKEASKSYTVYNVKSLPNHYPKYGDFLESCVLVSLSFVFFFCSRVNQLLKCCIQENVRTLVAYAAYTHQCGYSEQAIVH
jgi:hypothetical protein